MFDGYAGGRAYLFLLLGGIMPEETKGQAPAEIGEGQAPSPTKDMFDAEYVSSLRKENAEWRKKVRELEGKVGQFEQERMTETDRLKATAEAATKTAQEATARERQARLSAALLKAAVEQRVDPKRMPYVERLVEVSFGEDGEPVGVDKAVKRLLDEMPELRGAVAAPATNPTNPGRERVLTIEDVKRMTPDEINRRWDEVQVAMASGR